MDTIQAISNTVLKKPKADKDVLPFDKINTSAGPADSYVEEDPTVWEWVHATTPNGQQALQYLVSLFPFSSWIFSYNLQWLIGDLVAGMHVYLHLEYSAPNHK
jgi:hypothetical protein